MAAASGQPQDTNGKKPVTPQQRRLFMGLGAAGVLALLAAGLTMSGVLGGGGGTNDVAVAVAPGAVPGAAPGSVPAAPTVPAVPGAAAPGDAAVAGAVGAGVPATGTAAATVPQALQRFRPDPFQQAYFIPTPVPTLPPPKPPVVLPDISEVPPVFIPGVPGGNAALQRPLNLPPVRITRLDEGTRRPSSAFPPRRTLGGAGGAGVPDPSYDKRLSGVVIADGVRAILEIQGPNGPVSHVVQPGDEVDGITVLNIQRFNDGTRTVTRMLIRENGEERTVELRAGAAVAPAGGPDVGGPGGFPGGPPGLFRGGPSP